MSFIKKYFHKILLLSCIILSLLNLINCWVFKIEYVFLSENQILYIYSSLAQVIGALLGLTIAGYSMVDSKLKTLSELSMKKSKNLNWGNQNFWLRIFVKEVCIRENY